jgi:hypothetical protein
MNEWWITAMYFGWFGLAFIGMALSAHEEGNRPGRGRPSKW